MEYFKFITRFIIFWLVYFLVNRIVFALFFIEEVGAASINELLTILPKSIPLDISFISYLLVPIVVLFWINSFLKKQGFIPKVIYSLVGFFILLTGLIAGGEVALYSEWQTKLNFTALSHFVNPDEVFKTASLGHVFTSVLFIVISLVFIRIYKKKVKGELPIIKINNSLKNFTLSIIYLPFLLGILLLGIRGGFQPIPVNLSDAYFSNKIILNDIAVNSNWNILQSILKSKTNFEGNPYKKYSDEEAADFMNTLKPETDSVTHILKKKQPNIVFILLESWSADNVESLGGLDGITPNFKALEKEGLSFTDFYSNGWTSDQGMSSIFSSFPVFPYVAVINQADKSRKLPCLNKSLAEKGYHSSFFFGGQLTYGNIKGYLLSQGFDIVKDENDYQELPSGSLGVHDEFMFKQFKQELKQLPEPFMSTLFTISSHSPFDFPAEHKLSFNHKDDKYVNSVAYTDVCLGKFMESVKEEDWYANTLFVIVADHSHSSPIKRRVAQKERYKIPMLWIGEVLSEQYKGKQHNKMGSHIDIISSVLGQLNINNKAYNFGNDLFNPAAKSVVPYAFHKGYGLIRAEANYAFSESYNKVFESIATDSLQKAVIKKETELYFQAAFKEYMEL
ncbi:MAG: phosphoglycerol transferase MdoB-like AlkP superfamily enzyme [Thalassomonas sp.]|jgi:phosphoglycerol transferase MdoB-like AlkP superfamily enzyme